VELEGSLLTAALESTDHPVPNLDLTVISLRNFCHSILSLDINKKINIVPWLEQEVFQEMRLEPSLIIQLLNQWISSVGKFRFGSGRVL
jgi:hypothetical protein